MEIRWSSSELKRLIELRINEVFRSQYTGDKIKIEDIFLNLEKVVGKQLLILLLKEPLGGQGMFCSLLMKVL